MMTSGAPADPPVRVGVPFADLCAPVFAVVGILAALRQRDVTGAGRHVDVTARPLHRARSLPFGVVDRIGGILGKCVENVCEQQLLMLLLVVQSDLDDRKDALRCFFRNLPNQPFDCGVDMRTVGSDFRAVRARDQTTLRPRMTRTGGNIVGVEKKRKSLVEDPVRGVVRYQKELLEEPGDMRAVPLGRACIRHRLDDLVFGRQMRCAPFRFRAHAMKCIKPNCTGLIEGTLGSVRRSFTEGRRHSASRHKTPP